MTYPVAVGRDEVARAEREFDLYLRDEADRLSDRLDDYCPANEMAPRRGNGEAPDTRPVKEAPCHEAP